MPSQKKSPEKPAQSRVQEVGSRAAADAGQAGQSFPSGSIPQLKTPTDDFGMRMWLREEDTQVLSGTSQEPQGGRGSAERVSRDQGMW